MWEDDREEIDHVRRPGRAVARRPGFEACGLDQGLAVVRRGDVEARLRIHIGASEAEARRIVARAGQRLCAATPTC